MPTGLLLAGLDGGPVAKDVVITAAAAEAAIAGLVLVFLGSLLAALQGFPGDTRPSVLEPFRQAVLATVAVFAISLGVTAASVTWLALAGPEYLYGWVVGAFFVQLGAVLVLAVLTTRLLLR